METMTPSQKYLRVGGGMGLLAEVQHLRTMSNVNLVLGLCSVLYLAVNIVCIVLNGYDQEGPEAVISFRNFHLLEFWATFFFNIVQVVALVFTPKSMSDLYSSPLFLKTVIFINVGVTFISALLITVNTEEFEVVSHEMEYSNELTMSLVDLVFLVSLIRNVSGAVEKRRTTDFIWSVFVVVGSMLVSLVQLYIYNGMGWEEDGDSKGERLSHYFEFFFEAVSASITFWFVMDNRFLAETKVQNLMDNELGDAPNREQQSDSNTSVPAAPGSGLLS